MSRELPPDLDPGRGDEPEPSPGHIRTTGAGALVGLALVGLVLGWLFRPLSIRVAGEAPTVGWLPALALLLVAVILAAVAWSTYRALHPRATPGQGPPLPRRPLQPHQAVNRLVLAKACALAGAVVAGGYLGYALSWWRVSESALATQRLLHSAVTGAVAVLMVIGALLLERACRVGPEDGPDLG